MNEAIPMNTSPSGAQAMRDPATSKRVATAEEAAIKAERVAREAARAHELAKAEYKADVRASEAKLQAAWRARSGASQRLRSAARRLDQARSVDPALLDVVDRAAEVAAEAEAQAARIEQAVRTRETAKMAADLAEAHKHRPRGAPAAFTREDGGAMVDDLVIHDAEVAAARTTLREARAAHRTALRQVELATVQHQVEEGNERARLKRQERERTRRVGIQDIRERVQRRRERATGTATDAELKQLEKGSAA